MVTAVSHLRPSCFVGPLVLAAVLAGGCGSNTAVKTAPTHRAGVAKSVRAYRVGQYCLVAKEAKYRAAGLVCEHHHLSRR
jgi:hypothetical protein